MLGARAEFFPALLDAAHALAGRQGGRHQHQAQTGGFVFHLAVSVVVRLFLAQRGAQIGLRRQVVAAAHHVTTGLTVLAVQFVQAEGFKHHFVGVAEHVVQAQRVRLLQP